MARPGTNMSPPKDFGREARLVWFRSQTELRTRGTWRKSDGPLLEMYVRNVMTARRARRSSGLADLQIAQTAEAAALRLAQALLLTPAERRNPKSKKGTDEPPRLPAVA
jgi:phage terminase small subunit